MKKFLSPLVLAICYSKLSASPLTIAERQATNTGTGPYAPAVRYSKPISIYTSQPSQEYKQDPTLAGHTLFAPKSIKNGTKLPVLLWGQGGCSADSLQSAPFLLQLASHGILVLASGTPKGSGSTTAAQMTAGTDWIKSHAGKGAYVNVDASRIMAAGWSCGGIEAYAQYWDDRVEGLGIWSSGLLTNYSMASLLTKPMFYFLGGPEDIAYENVCISSYPIFLG